MLYSFSPLFILYLMNLTFEKGICPGAVNTNIFPEEIHFYVKHMARLEPTNIADAVLYALRTPPHVQVGNQNISVYTSVIEINMKSSRICLF